MNSEKIKNTLYEIGFDEKIISIKIIKNGTFEDNSFFKKVITLIVETKSHFWEFIIGQVLNYQIFCQDLVHNGWTDQTIILERSMFLKDHKRVIIYLFNTGFSINEIIWKKVNEVFLIEKKYSEVWKVYITKEKILAAFKNFLTKEKSNIIKNYSSIFDRKQKINKNLFDLGIRDFYQNKKKIKKAKFPKVTVITVVYNNAVLIEQTIQSIINQRKIDLEYIIIDGGSTDGTLQVIKKYNLLIDKFISEPDRGIFDAMNKGLSIASNNWYIFINSDDFLYNNMSLYTALNNAKKNAVVGKVFIVGKKINWIRPKIKKNDILKYSHQAFFCKKKVKFALENKISADAHVMKNFQSDFEHASNIVSVFRLGGYSSGQVTKQHFKETFKMYGISRIFLILIKFLIHILFGDYLSEILQRFKASK